MTEENISQSPKNPEIPAVVPMTEAQERNLAMWAHLSILLNLFTGWLGLIPPIIIYFEAKKRSSYLADQSLKALVFQLVFFFGGGLLAGTVWAMTGVLSLLLVGLLLVPLALLVSLIPLASCAYAIKAAIDSNHGEDFQYWLVGGWVRSDKN
jgi:uncharacterized Tic20 family protein